MRTLVAGLLLLALAACDFTGLSTRVTGRQPFTPPPVYGEWWAETESCSGATGDLAAIDWYLATGISSDAVSAFGLWLPPHEIVLVRGFEDSRFTVRHEMLHDLLRGDPEHEDPAWTRCGLLKEG